MGETDLRRHGDGGRGVRSRVDRHDGDGHDRRRPSDGGTDVSGPALGRNAGTVEDVSLSEPGFVSLRREAPNGDLVGVSDNLDAGEYGTVEIELDDSLEEETTLVALPHRDTTENGSYDHEDGSDVDYP